MFDAALPSEPGATEHPRTRWADGAAEVTVGATDGVTRLRHLYQSDPCRILFPRTPADAPFEAVVVTTSGGIVGGDRLRFAMAAENAGHASITTQAAEKIYRSAGADAEIDVSVAVGADGFLEWMPQETILFDGARLRRRTEVEIDARGGVLTGEIVVFGRRARGESFEHGLLHDAWRFRHDGKLIWADALHLDSRQAEHYANHHAFDGAVAIGTLIYAGARAETALAVAREYEDAGIGATRLDDLVIVRIAGTDAAMLRAGFANIWKHLRHAVAGFPARLPRVWEV